MIINITSNIYERFFQGSFSVKKTLTLLNRPLSLGGHVESQENKKLFFCMVSLALNWRLGEACREKSKFFILLRLNMAPCDKAPLHKG